MRKPKGRISELWEFWRSVVPEIPQKRWRATALPPLDYHGNSVRGIRVCEELSRRFDLHQLNRPGMGRSTIRLRLTGADYSSRRIRSAEQSRILREQGQRIRIWQLQGDLAFTTAEVLMKDILAASTEFGKAQWIVVDFKRLQSINETACTLLYQLLQNLRASNRHLVFAATERVPQLRRILRLKMGTRFESDYRNLCIDVCARLRKLTRELSVFD